MNLHRLIIRLFATELSLIYANLAEVLQPVAFFLLVTSLFPLGLSPEPSQLHLMAPSVIWVGILLANFIGLERLFTDDYREGCIEQWCLSPYPLSLIVFIKVMTHWLITVVPLLVVCPIIGLWYNMTSHEIHLICLTVLIGSPVLSFVGAIGQALLVRHPQSGVLLAILIIPLYIPVLIFGAGSVSDSVNNVNAALAMLGSMSLLAVATAPFAIAGSLRFAL